MNKQSRGLARLMASSWLATIAPIGYEDTTGFHYGISRESGPLLDSANAKIEAAKQANKTRAEQKKNEYCQCYGCATMRHPCANDKILDTTR